MENVKVVFRDTNGDEQEYVPISFRFVRERYTPYTQCTGTFIGDVEVSLVSSIKLYYNDRILHYGMADSIKKNYKNGRYIVSFMSRGYSMLLGQNEPKPGIRSKVNLANLMSENTHIPNVTCQAYTQQVNYIYAKEKSTIWDAICAYSYKAYHSYPYIRNTNVVYASAPSEPQGFNYNTENVVSLGEGVSTSGMLSKLYMSDTEGEYTYTQESSVASDYSIVRTKYYPLDKQWLAAPEDGLKSKLNYSNKGVYSAWLVYPGHNFENLMDKADHSQLKYAFMRAEYICGVEVFGNKNGVFTKISIYRDSYS